MRVVYATRFGGPDVLAVEEAPDPKAAAREVVVGVSVAPVLFLETQLRRGWGTEWFPVEPPYVPGGGVAGEVVSTGEGVDPGWIGRRVVARTDGGGYAEQAAVPEGALIPVPDGLGLPEAAALLHDGATALGLADEAPIEPGTWVLVVAAAGGLGTLLVQLAHVAGARVIGAARTERKLALIRRLGADAAVDYSQPGWPERVREMTGGAGPDVVFDGAGGHLGREAFEVTARGGWFSAHGTPGGAFAGIDPKEAQRRGITVCGIERVQFAPTEAKRLVRRALSEAAEGRISPVIGQTFPLERVAEAHAAIESRETVGKTLLVVSRE
ncbi:zinc-binding dehydrogenase [Rubrobacter calidifluminis]|uniref:zinc-binding dehydrogenase n=1 Tax=Rubrobacter calidifluminis TaxID=1392640 RepID=UPI002361D47F|nr:zinc-binding dehydrogenase [Rubrobacter calidifluminis]